MVGAGLHIGIILDGNRRYAKQKGMVAWMGHRAGANKLDELIKWCRELHVKELTLYTFSIENFNREEKEKEELFKLFRTKLKKMEDDNKINDERIKFIGRLNMFPSDIKKSMQDLMKKTKDNNGLIINFAMAYGGRAEIVDAVKKIGEKIEAKEITNNDVNEKIITDNLYLQDEPDMIIRPGGEKRVSNFLIWQSHYSEWYFTDKLWPEFKKADIVLAIDEFRNRERRYGK